MPDYLLQELRRSVAAGHAAVIAGAGVSIQATDGLATSSWVGLLDSGVERCCDIRPELHRSWREKTLADIRSESLTRRIRAAQDIQSNLEALPGNQFRKWLKDTVGSFTPVSPGLLKAIVDLRLPTVTTNYDDLLASALAARDKLPSSRLVTW